MTVDSLIAAYAIAKRRDASLARIRPWMYAAVDALKPWDSAYFLGTAHGMLLAHVAEFGGDLETTALAEEIEAKALSWKARAA